jgi:hypothetical protein
MTRCCSEWRCRRKTPFALGRGALTGTVYLVTRQKLVKDNGDGTGIFEMQDRHEITEQMEKFIRREAEWVREVLGEVVEP